MMADRDPETGRFLPGNRGNGGRPKGSRNKLGEQFLADLHEEWEENGKTVIAAVRKDKPDVLLKVIASILPKELNVNVSPFEEMTDDQLKDHAARLVRELGPLFAVGGDPDARDGQEATRH